MSWISIHHRGSPGPGEALLSFSFPPWRKYSQDRQVKATLLVVMSGFLFLKSKTWGLFVLFQEIKEFRNQIPGDFYFFPIPLSDHVLWRASSSWGEPGPPKPGCNFHLLHYSVYYRKAIKQQHPQHFRCWKIPGFSLVCWTTHYSTYLQGCWYFLFICLLDRARRRASEHTPNMSIKVCPAVSGHPYGSRKAMVFCSSHTMR